MAHRREITALPRLLGNQAAATMPRERVRLSASAGTGKTQVLSARVLRLLLHGAAPESILCLTFTKAGAAEMADRIHERLSAWVTMKGSDLGRDLANLGEEIAPAERDNARTLFARVLDARGSGLRIQTIHSFCQSLLAAFPAEAGLTPGFRAVEGREADQLAAKVLADLVEGFKREGRLGDLERLERTALRLGEDATRAFLGRCAAAPEALEGLPRSDGFDAQIRHWLADVDDIAGYLEAKCGDAVIPRARLEFLIQENRAWGAKTGDKNAEQISLWLGSGPSERAEMLDDLVRVWQTRKGEISKIRPKSDAYLFEAQLAVTWCVELLDIKRARDLAPAIADALHVGRAYARTYDDAKRNAGMVDFGDLIRNTVRLLRTPGIGEWIRYKLDQSVDHILVDEAQDTNADQWEIVKALADEYFVGAGKPGAGVRTIFLVGDFKQAIFGFQGTDPREFERATQHFAALAHGAGQELLQLSLSDSFRSSQPVLDLTDAVIRAVTPQAMGLPEQPDAHHSAVGGAGSVVLLDPVSVIGDGETEREAEEEWLTESELKWADSLARMVRDWIDGGLRLKRGDRIVEPGDVMILVRSRGELARLIVSRLYQYQVPVAGMDRLRLGAPIAVQDLLACIRFVLQPGDDLSLAALLVSPLVGWSQEELYERAKRREGSLWSHLGEHRPDVLKLMLDMADRVSPYRFLETILSGPISGRKRLIARLGEEARDPIEALLNTALEFERQPSPTLQQFIEWFDRGDVEIKRDPAKPENAVRVMTVHGAKGLQAPVVVLADATRDPANSKQRELDWEPEAGRKIPLYWPRREDRIGSLAASADSHKARDAEEHWRLLYVAMTRAEEHLFIGGALNKKQQGKELGEGVWHRRIGEALVTLGARAEDGALSLHLAAPAEPKPSPFDAVERWQGAIPDWATKPAAPEARPPRPLVPSALGVSDSEPSPPPLAGQSVAARRGTLLHSLFERLPGVQSAEREAAAHRWLETATGIADKAMREALVRDALAIIDDPQFAAIFGNESLAEVPVSGVVDGFVIAGTMDRLLITEQEILIIDFKTGRRVPAGEFQVSDHHKAQMGAYAALLTGIFPGRLVRAALLYTSGPRLVSLSAETLARFKPGFVDPQQVYSPAS